MTLSVWAQSRRRENMSERSELQILWITTRIRVFRSGSQEQKTRMSVGYLIEFLLNQPCAHICFFCRRAQSYVRDSQDRSRQDNMLRLTEERRSMYRGDQTPKTIRSARELSQPRLDDNWHETVSSIKNMATMYVATAGIGVATTDQKAVPSSTDVMCRLNWHSPSSSIGKPHQEPVSTSISKMSVTPHQTEPPAGYSKPTADHPTTGGKTGSLFQDTEHAEYYPTADTCSAFSYHLGQSSASSQRPAASHDDLIRHRPSASPSADHQLASPKTYGETHKDQRYEATFDAPPNMENKMESDFRFSGEEYRESLVETLQKAGKKGCPDRSSNVGVSQEGMPETSEEPSAYRIPMDCGHPAGHQSVPSKVTTMRRDQEPRTTYTTLYRCAFCPKEFKKPYQLREHERVHTGERPFKCDVCSKSFNRRWTLDNHRRIHSGRREYTCKECGKSFTQSCHLRVHERIHSGQRQHMCKECGKSFTQSCHLRVHERIHSGQRQHMCKECGKSFIHACRLRVHERIHSGQRQHMCKECGKSFIHACHLRVHERIHTDERPFTCKFCDKSFRQKSHLRLHNIRVHAAERPDMWEGRERYLHVHVAVCQTFSNTCVYCHSDWRAFMTRKRKRKCVNVRLVFLILCKHAMCYCDWEHVRSDTLCMKTMNMVMHALDDYCQADVHHWLYVFGSV